MSLFGRREEPLHERLLRAGGLDDPVSFDEGELALAEPGLLMHVASLHGAARPREWDAVVTATAPDLVADSLELVVIEDGTVFMEDELPQGSLEPLCDAVEARLRPPYRARAVRQDGALWAISARRIELVVLRVTGDELDLTVTRAGRELRIDGHDRLESIPELELRSNLPAEFHAHATRVGAHRWELDLSPL